MVVVLAVQLLEGKSADIALITFSGQQALAWSNGKMAWSYNFGQSLRPLNPGELSQEYAIQDLKGDGGKQILVAAPLRLFIEGEPSTDALYCFTARGKLLWRQDYSDRVHFGGEDCGPRWDICSLTVTGPVADRKIWTAACSHPTSVAILFRSDADGGHRTTFFVNYGHLGRLSEIQKPEGSYLLAGGINNECDCAMLAILKETGTGGRSPQTGSLVQCDHCPAGQPVRYFLFPRSEVNQVGGMAYNPVYNILVTGRHFSVMTTELAPEDPPPDWALYEFSDEWVPRSVIFSDHYWEDHRRFTAEHKIGHSLDACPERLQADHSSRVES